MRLGSGMRCIGGTKRLWTWSADRVSRACDVVFALTAVAISWVALGALYTGYRGVKFVCTDPIPAAAIGIAAVRWVAR